MLFRNLKMFAFTLTIVALFVGLSGCEKVITTVTDHHVEEVMIGIALAETGANASPYGRPMKRGLELAREEINMLGDIRITFVRADAKSTVEGGVEAVKQLVGQDVPVIIGIGISTHLEQAFPIAQEAGVVAISPISSAAGLSGQVGDYAFRIGLATDVLMPIGVMRTKEKLNYENVAVIYDEADTYSTSVKDELDKALTANNVTNLSTETFETLATDFTMQLTNIMNLDPQPDALFVAALSAEMVQIIKQADELGITDTVDLIVPDLTNAEVERAGTAAEGAVAFAGWSGLFDTPGNQAFTQNFMEKHGFAPSPWAAQAYATLYILNNALKNADLTDAASIRDELAKTKDYTTILGDFSFDENGEAIYELHEERVALIVENGKLKVLE